MLIDHCTIFVRSGKGGNGCVSLCREKYRPKGGPNGGDGGCGGDVVLVGDQSVSTLLSLTPRPHYRAKNGMPGLGSSMNGAAADHTLIAVPLGTIAVDRETGETMMGRVPAYSVVVPGSLPGKPLPDGSPGPSLYCAVIVKRVDAQTRSKTSINELLRD